MGNKRRLPGAAPNPGLYLIQDGDMSTTIVSPTFNCLEFDNIGLQVSWTASNGTTGTITVDCSIDGVTFTPLTFSPALTQPNGDTNTILIDLNQVPFPYMTVQFVPTMGVSGDLLQVFVSAKDVN
jgi:hypothetical protein